MSKEERDARRNEGKRTRRADEKQRETAERETAAKLSSLRPSLTSSTKLSSNG